MKGKERFNMEITEEQKIKMDKFHEIMAEIMWIEEVAEVTRKYHCQFNELASKYEYLHNRLNELIMNLKQLKIVLHKHEVELIQNVKKELWGTCSAKYKQEFMSNGESFSM